MDETEASIGAAAILLVEKLKTLQAPSRNLGYNDVALMIAFARSDAIPEPLVNAPMIYDYLTSGHPAIPEGIMRGLGISGGSSGSREDIDYYLGRLSNITLIIRDNREADSRGYPNYTMRGFVSDAIAGEMPRLKSPHLEDLFFHGFRIHCLYELVPS